MKKNNKFILALCLIFNMVVHGMETSEPIAITTKFQDTLTQLAMVTTEKLSILISKLKKAEKFKRPDWPIILMKDNDILAKELAIQIAHELGRSPIVLTGDDVSDKPHIKTIKIASNEKYIPKLYIIDNLNQFYDSFKSAYNRMASSKSEELLKKLLLMHAQFNPLIVVESNETTLPLSIQDLFSCPWRKFPKIIPVHYSGNYVRFKLVTDWCKEHNIDCLYSVSSLRLPPGLYTGALEQEVTILDDIVQAILTVLKTNDKLKYKDYKNVLDQLSITQIKVEPIIPNNANTSAVAAFRILKKDENHSSASYKAAINLDDFTQLVKNSKSH